MRLDYEQHELTAQLNQIKLNIFGTSDVVLHRREIMDGTAPFHVLNDPQVRGQFDDALMQLLDSGIYRVFTVVIDKKEQVARYKVWRSHPYHYCLKLLLERYVQWLDRINNTGDVMAESRGKNENIQLERTFRYLYKNGTDHVPAKLFQKRLTSKELKLRPKTANVTGLQLADLIANPSCRDLICQKKGVAMLAPFGVRVVTILKRTKYLKKPGTRRIDGWGVKWLP